MKYTYIRCTIRGRHIYNYIILNYTYIKDSKYYYTFFDHQASPSASIYRPLNSYQCSHERLL